MSNDLGPADLEFGFLGLMLLLAGYALNFFGAPELLSIFIGGLGAALMVLPSLYILLLLLTMFVVFFRWVTGMTHRENERWHREHDEKAANDRLKHERAMAKIKATKTRPPDKSDSDT